MSLDIRTEDCFFHYTTREASFDYILPSGQLRFSPYWEMRDPLENTPWTWMASWSPFQKEPGLPEKKLYGFWRNTHSVFRLAHLLAFTIDTPGADRSAFAQGWFRPRMWEQYAEDHQGVCLVFNKKHLIATLDRDLKSQLGHEPYHGPVSYSEEGSRAFAKVDVDTLPNEQNQDFAEAYIEHHKDELFFQKVLDWQTEYEYRFVTTAPPEVPLYVDYGDSLCAVVVGERLPHWQYASALKASRISEVPVALMNWRTGFPVQVPLLEQTWEQRKASVENRPFWEQDVESNSKAESD